ncbi:TPA: recombinase family protein [Escherichia coli]
MAQDKIVYRRVSSTGQNLDRQLHDLPFEDTAEYKVFHDKTSGKNFDRPAWKELRSYIRKGDHIYIHSLDRMGRNLLEILQEIDYLVKEVKVNLHLEKEKLDLLGGEDLNPMVKMQLQIMGAVAEMERELINERRREGIAAAKAAGKHCGRPAKGHADPEVVMKALAEGKSIREVAREFGISPSMVYRIKNAPA